VKKIDAVANASWNGQFYLLTTMSQGMLDYGEPSVPPYFLPPDVDDKTLGATLRQALSGSKKVGVEEFQKIFHSGIIQERGKAREAEAMEKYGYKTKRALYKNMLCCWISVFDGNIEIKPTHHKVLDAYSGLSNDGPEIQHLAVTCSDAELGAALREGFKRCTSAAS
jgi:CDI immunity protein